MSSSSGSSSKARTLKLFCPSLSKIVPLLAWDEQRLDLGSIARIFGLDPCSLKLNGHFISRGVDLVSSSVTWRSLLNFFSAKGLSTGKDDKDALTVDGKLSKIGTKRAQDPEGTSSRIHYTTELENVIGANGSTPLQHQHINSFANKKTKETHSGYLPSKWNDLGFKRKQRIEDVPLLKKLKINGANSGTYHITCSEGYALCFKFNKFSICLYYDPPRGLDLLDLKFWEYMCIYQMM